MLEALLDQLVEADGIDEEGLVDSLGEVLINASVLDGDLVDAVAGDRSHVLRLQYHARYVQVLRIV